MRVMFFLANLYPFSPVIRVRLTLFLHNVSTKVTGCDKFVLSHKLCVYVSKMNIYVVFIFSNAALWFHCANFSLYLLQENHGETSENCEKGHDLHTETKNISNVIQDG